MHLVLRGAHDECQDSVVAMATTRFTCDQTKMVPKLLAHSKILSYDAFRCIIRKNLWYEQDWALSLAHRNMLVPPLPLNAHVTVLLDP